MILFPAIDLLDGKAVRLFQGDYAQATVYAEHPADQAAAFEAEGAHWLHVVDLDGAKSGRPMNLDAIQAITSRVAIPVQVGGGIRSIDDARQLLESGVARVILGSRLVQDLEFAEQVFGELGDQAVAGIDARGGKVAVHGWTATSDVTAEALAQAIATRGAKRVVVTDIARDGALSGPNLDLALSVHRASGLPVIVSGGISALADLKMIAAAGEEVEGVIVGKALYEKRFTLNEALGAVSR